MPGKSLSILTALLLSASAWAETISQEQLTGTWEFAAWAAAAQPQNKQPVGVRMNFRDDGTVISEKPAGHVEGRYTINGDTIIYSDADGEQQWQVQSFQPGEELVVRYEDALMFFEKI